MFRPETHENLTAWGLGALGAVRSLPEFIHPHPEHKAEQTELKSALPALITLLGLVTAYDVVAPNRQYKTISGEIHTNLETHRALTVGVVMTLTAHLLRIFPERLDPIHLSGEYLRDKIYGPTMKKTAEKTLLR